MGLRLFGGAVCVDAVAPGSRAARLARPLARGDVVGYVGGARVDASEGIDAATSRFAADVASWPLTVSFERSAAFAADFVAAAPTSDVPPVGDGGGGRARELSDAARARRAASAPPPPLSAAGDADGGGAGGASLERLSRADRLRLAQFRRQLATGLLLQKHLKPGMANTETVATVIYCSQAFDGVWWCVRSDIS